MSIFDLPQEMLMEIVSHMQDVDLYFFGCSCRYFWSLSETRFKNLHDKLDDNDEAIRKKTWFGNYFELSTIIFVRQIRVGIDRFLDDDILQNRVQKMDDLYSLIGNNVNIMTRKNFWEFRLIVAKKLMQNSRKQCCNGMIHKHLYLLKYCNNDDIFHFLPQLFAESC